jgi:hypothetical protein
MVLKSVKNMQEGQKGPKGGLGVGKYWHIAGEGKR